MGIRKAKETKKSVKKPPFPLKKKGKKELTIEEWEDELEDELDENDDDFEDDEDEEGEVEEMNSATQDLFDYIDREFVAKAKPVQFTIYESNMLLGQEMAPFSWLEVQQKYGGGIFRIQAKDMATKRFIRQETKTLAGKRSNHWEGGRVSDEKAGEPETLTTQDVIALMEAKVREAKEEARREFQGRSTSETSNMSVIATMMQQSSNQFQTMMSELNKSQMEMFKHMMESQSKMAERFEAQIEKIATKPTHQEKPMGTLELLKMIESSKKDGMDQMKMILELADSKADEKADLLSKIEALAHGEKPSMLDNVLKGLAPLLAANLSQGMSQVPASPQVTPQNHQVVEARPREAYQPVVNHANQVMKKAIDVPRPVKPMSVLPALEKESPKPKKESSPVNSMKDSLEKHQIVETLLDPIKGWLMNQTPANVAASEARKLLAQKSILIENVKKSFTVDDLISLRKKYGVPSLADGWLKDFYGNLTEQKAAKNTANGSTRAPA